MDLMLTNRVAVVTGTAQGIGAAIAKELAQSLRGDAIVYDLSKTTAGSEIAARI